MWKLSHGTRTAALLLCTATIGAFAAETTRWQWKLSEFTWIKRQPAEAGAPANTHPVRIELEALRQHLSTLRFENGAESDLLFAKDELTALLEPLREALSLATPSEDLILLSTHRRTGGFMGSSFGLTARLFVQEGNLNLLVHDTRLDFLDRYRGMQVLPEFNYGSRSTASAVKLVSPGGLLHRPDWLLIPLDGLVKPSAVPPPAQVAPAPSAPAAMPPVASPAAPKTRDAAFFEEQEKRLRALKRMRDENLITEAEYQQKRNEILQSL